MYTMDRFAGHMEIYESAMSIRGYIIMTLQIDGMYMYEVQHYSLCYDSSRVCTDIILGL